MHRNIKKLISKFILLITFDSLKLVKLTDYLVKLMKINEILINKQILRNKYIFYPCFKRLETTALVTNEAKCIFRKKP